MIRSIRLYDNCDILLFKNDVEWLGFDAQTSFGEMINLAMQNNCKVIVKNGKGKWYLKGSGYPYDMLKNKMEENVGKYPRLKCWLIEYNDDAILEEKSEIEEEESV